MVCRSHSNDLFSTLKSPPKANFQICHLTVGSPGRWHADAVLKMTLAYILIHFDFRLESPSLRHTWWWETFQMAKENTRVLFRRKVDSATVKQAGH